MIFGEIASALSVFDWIRKLFPWRKAIEDTQDTIYLRFLKMFEINGVNRNQIPQLFPDDLCIADVQSESALLPKLSEKVLSECCSLFNVRRGWLDCVDDYMFETYDFYKQPDEFSHFLDTLIKSGNALHGTVCREKKLKKQTPVVIVITETIATLGDNNVYRYHICPFGNGGYFKSQAYLSACVALAWKKGVYLRGATIKKKYLIDFLSGMIALPLEDALVSRAMWYPEDMVSLVDAYLENVNPESDNFGYKAAILEWIDLEEKGYMDAGFGEVDPTPFISRLKELN